MKIGAYAGSGNRLGIWQVAPRWLCQLGSIPAHFIGFSAVTRRTLNGCSPHGWGGSRFWGSIEPGELLPGEGGVTDEDNYDDESSSVDAIVFTLAAFGPLGLSATSYCTRSPSFRLR